MGDNLRTQTWEFIVLLCVTLAGWAFTAGSMYAHLNETADRLKTLEQKVDLILLHEVNKKGQRLSWPIVAR